MNNKNNSNKKETVKKDTNKLEKKNKPTETNNSIKTGSKNKSASQLSISHFSSVSTPEYRKGWDLIWGSKNSNSKTNSTIESNKLPNKIVLTNEDLSKKNKLNILSELKSYSKRNNLVIPESYDLNLGAIDFSCTLKLKYK